MKKLEFYQCDVCGAQYKSKKECERCEQSHKQGLYIVEVSYLSPDGTGVPAMITVTDASGKEYTYKRCVTKEHTYVKYEDMNRRL